MASAVVTYFDVTAAEHQRRYNTLAAQGYRLVSLCMSGTPADPKYAAVWIERLGPAWAAVHGLSAQEYQAAHQKWNEKGYVPTLISAVGPVKSAVFAGAFEHRDARNWIVRFGMREGTDQQRGTFQAENKWAHEHHYLLRCAALYGDAAERAYAAIWEPNPLETHWVCRAREPSAEFQNWFHSLSDVPLRPALISVSSDHQYLSIFRNDSVGAWTARYGITAQELETLIKQRSAEGSYPISLQAGGSGGAARYSAVFAKQDSPRERVWRATGLLDDTLAGLEEQIKKFMQKHGVRVGQLAVARKGKLKLNRAYTWSDSSYRQTEPSHVMRLASLSKAFACAAIQHCYDDKILEPTARVFPLLGIARAALAKQQPSPWIDEIEVRHLVQHAGGWNSKESGFDAVFNIRKIGLALELPGAPSKRDVARYMYGEPLQFRPGAKDFKSTDGASYSNFGYLLMGLVVEKVSGMPFIDYLRTRVLEPIAVKDVVVGHTLRSERLEHEVSYDDPHVGLPATDPHSEKWVPYCYGGEGYMTEVMDSGGGLVASAADLVKFIHHRAVWGMGGRAAGSTRRGSMAGVSSMASSRSDGIDYAYILNTRHFPAQERHEAVDELGKSLREALDRL